MLIAISLVLGVVLAAVIGLTVTNYYFETYRTVPTIGTRCLSNTIMRSAIYKVVKTANSKNLRDRDGRKMKFSIDDFHVIGNAPFLPNGSYALVTPVNADEDLSGNIVLVTNSDYNNYMSRINPINNKLPEENYIVRKFVTEMKTYDLGSPEETAKATAEKVMGFFKSDHNMNKYPSENIVVDAIMKTLDAYPYNSRFAIVLDSKETKTFSKIHIVECIPLDCITKVVRYISK